jgi:hypothetical protein
VPPNSLLKSKALAHHGVGMCAIVAGAALTESFGSMWPLAMGSALGLMTLAGLVREIRRRSRARWVGPGRR